MAVNASTHEEIPASSATDRGFHGDKNLMGELLRRFLRSLVVAKKTWPIAGRHQVLQRNFRHVLASRSKGDPNPQLEQPVDLVINSVSLSRLNNGLTQLNANKTTIYRNMFCGWLWPFVTV